MVVGLHVGGTYGKQDTSRRLHRHADARALPMCRKAGLNDLAYLLEVAAAEASKDRVVRPVTNGVTHGAVHQLSAYTA